MSALRDFLDAVYDHANGLLDAVRADHFDPLETEWTSSTHPESGREWKTGFVPNHVTNTLANATFEREWERALRENPQLAEYINKLADAHRALIRAAGEARDRGDSAPDGDVYEAHQIALRGLAALAPRTTDPVEELSNAIQDTQFFASPAHRPQTLAEERSRQDALRLIDAADESLLSRNVKVMAGLIQTAQGEELEECKRVLRRAQAELRVAQGTAGEAGKVEEHPPAEEIKPVWNRNTKTITWLGKVIYTYKRTCHQTVILDSFEDSEWKREIDSPVSGTNRTPASNRTKDAVSEMCEQLKPLRFHTLNAGKQILWSSEDENL